LLKKVPFNNGYSWYDTHFLFFEESFLFGFACFPLSFFFFLLFYVLSLFFF
jgi:hypothetical protein